MRTNFQGAKNFVQMKRDHHQESLSGPGSWLVNATDTIEFINQTIEKYDVQSILDLGCGDWNWFQRVRLNGSSYQGWDADQWMIEENQSRFGNRHVEFRQKDIAVCEYPAVDLIICRDVLFHMEIDIALSVIERARGRCKYFLATSYSEVAENTGPKRYTDFDEWGFYHINLDIEPFNLLAEELEHREERITAGLRAGGEKRRVCLYSLQAR